MFSRNFDTSTSVTYIGFVNPPSEIPCKPSTPDGNGPEKFHGSMISNTSLPLLPPPSTSALPSHSPLAPCTQLAPQVAHPFQNTRPLTVNPTSTTTHTTDDSAPHKMPNQGVVPENRKTGQQRFQEVMDFMESVWKVWVALNECWIRLMVLMSNNVEAPRRVDGEEIATERKTDSEAL
ncbi:hypothetical protein K435DRAFT_853356 [Dendrothele bispora CBS 962.96]|uniref:Uncharacterized protein n=1 Tax=Dendrothele bispora (strain CBS 962.96) TaxID=1314807 RepID=A0A4S8MHV8_DENBC|nr:hypothetical protein K435DRAFT_853356 [Dendrothele bispora CBS 962.96]